MKMNKKPCVAVAMLAAFVAPVLLSLCANADTHVWKFTGRVYDWDWNEPDNYDSSFGAACCDIICLQGEKSR